MEATVSIGFDVAVFIKIRRVSEGEVRRPLSVADLWSLFLWWYDPCEIQVLHFHAIGITPHSESGNRNVTLWNQARCGNALEVPLRYGIIANKLRIRTTTRFALEGNP